MLGYLDKSDFLDLFYFSTRKENNLHLDLLICKYASQIDSTFFPLLNQSFTQSYVNCKLFLSDALNEKLNLLPKCLNSIDTVNQQYLSPMKLFLEGISCLYQREEHRSKYKFFESIKLSNGQFQNTTFKCLSLIGLAFVYLKSDLSQAYRVLHSAYSLAVKIKNPKLLAVAKMLLKIASSNPKTSEICK